MNLFRAFLLGLLLYAAVPSLAAGDSDAEPIKRELRLIYIFEGQKPEFVFVIGDSGFKSVASLKAHLETWPRGSELTWAPGCERFGVEPLLSSEQEMNAFKAFLAQHGITLVLVPSG